MQWYRRSAFVVERTSISTPVLDTKVGENEDMNADEEAVAEADGLPTRGFTLADARAMMLHPGSVLRELTLGQLCFKVRSCP